MPSLCKSLLSLIRTLGCGCPCPARPLVKLGPIREQRAHPVWTLFPNPFRQYEVLFMFSMTDSQQTTLSLQGSDKKGNPTGPLPAGTQAKWSVDNPNVLALTPSADTLSCNVAAAGPLSPGATVSVSVTNPDGSDGGTGSLAIQIVAGSPTTIAIVPGTPTEQP